MSETMPAIVGGPAGDAPEVVVDAHGLRARGALLSAFVEIGTDLHPRAATDPRALVVRRLQLFGENDTFPRDDSGGSTSLVVQIYRGLVPAADPEIDRVIALGSLARFPAATEPALAAMTALSRSLVDDSHLPFSIEPMWARAVGSMIASLTGITPSVEVVNSARQHQVARAVERFASDPRLSPETLAETLGISRRALYLLTGPEMGGIGEHIRAARARLAERMLRDPEYDILPMNEIALRSGLSSAQHLIRVLRSVYGASPVDIRARRASGE